jgi:hypothetical protein
MIRNIIIFSSSGIVLYERAFNNGTAGVKPSMLGNLMVAMHTFSHQTTGMSVSFIELSKISVAMKWQNKIGCCLIYDRSDGKQLGQLICMEVLDAFIQDYTGAMNFVGLNNTTEYKGFSKRLANVIYYSIRPIMVYLESIRGIKKALVINTPHEVIDSQQDHTDDFAILSDTASLVELANALSKYYDQLLCVYLFGIGFVLIVWCFVCFLKCYRPMTCCKAYQWTPTETPA